MNTATGIRILNEAAQRSTEHFSLRSTEHFIDYNDWINHSWKYNLRIMAKMLEGEIPITHGRRESRQELLGIIWVSECQDCCNAFELRLKYLNIKHGSPFPITVQLIK